MDKAAFIKVLKKFRKLSLNPNFIEYENPNYLEVGNNELTTVIQGNYPTETWPEEEVFWTNGDMEAVIQSEGDEDRIVLEFHIRFP